VAGDFTMLVADDVPSHPRLHVAGELDLASLSQFRRLLAALLERRPATIEVDISRVELVETITAAALLRAQRDAHARGTEVRIEGATASVAAILTLAATRLQERERPRA
jgi:anti-anti-sigma factor